MGTAELACASLKALIEEPGFEVLAVVTQPDRPAGRELKPQPSAVKKLAIATGRPVLQPEKAREPGFIDQLRALSPDLIVVAAYGQILPKAILELPRLGCVNVHTSLLPKYRGAAPIQWAILNDDACSCRARVATSSPVGVDDQLRHATSPKVLLTPSPKLPGTDGRKMSKSYGNTIQMTDAEAVVRQCSVAVKE